MFRAALGTLGGAPDGSVRRNVARIPSDPKRLVGPPVRHWHTVAALGAVSADGDDLQALPAQTLRRPTWISGAVGGELAEREEFVDGFVYADGEEVAVWDGFAVGVDAKESAVVDRGHAD